MSDTATPTTPTLGLPPIMRANEVAQRTGLTVKQLATYRCNGGGPEFVKAGHRTVLYTGAAVESWISDRTRRSTSDQGRKAA